MMDHSMDDGFERLSNNVVQHELRVSLLVDLADEGAAQAHGGVRMARETVRRMRDAVARARGGGAHILSPRTM